MDASQFFRAGSSSHRWRQGDGSQLWQMKALPFLHHCRCGRDMITNRNVLSQTKGHIFLKVQAQYDSIKLSSGPVCSRWFRVLGRWWVRWRQMWGACPDQGHLPYCWQHMLCPLHLEIKQLPWIALKPLILCKQRTLNYAGKFVYFCKGTFTLRLQTFNNRYISIGSLWQESLKTIPCRNTPLQCSLIKH